MVKFKLKSEDHGSFWFSMNSLLFNSLGFPDRVVSFSASEGIDLDGAVIEVIVSDWEELTLFGGCDYNIPFLSGFGSEIISDARGFEGKINILTVVNWISYHFWSCSKTIVVRLHHQVCFFKTWLIFSFFRNTCSCGFPDCVWELECSEVLIPDCAVIVGPAREFGIGLVKNFGEYVPFLVVGVIEHVVFDALRGKGNSKGFTLGNGIINGFYAIVWASDWGDESWGRKRVFKLR